MTFKCIEIHTSLISMLIISKQNVVYNHALCSVFICREKHFYNETSCKLLDGSRRYRYKYYIAEPLDLSADTHTIQMGVE